MGNQKLKLDFVEFLTKPVEATGVEVTKENMGEIARWTNGQVLRDKSGVRVPTRLGEAIAKEGYWVLQTNTYDFIVMGESKLALNFTKRGNH